jgi:hypothetical protein
VPKASILDTASRCARRSVESGATVCTSDPIETTIASSAGRSSPRNTRAADLASSSRAPAMLKLLSIATATDSGKSPAAKFSSVWVSPSSRTSKSSRVSPRIGSPFASVTLA